MWVLLSALAVTNSCAIAGYALFLSIGTERMPELVDGLPAAQLGLLEAYGTVGIILAQQAGLISCAVLAYSLKRPGPIVATRRGGVLLALPVALLLATSVVALWIGPALAYELTAGMGPTIPIDSGDVVDLPGPSGSVRVPRGWKAEVSSAQPKPPRWLPVRDTPDGDLAQSIIMYEASRDTTGAFTADASCVVVVYPGPEQFNNYHAGSVAASKTVEVALPATLLGGTAPPALLQTYKDRSGDGWKSTMRVALNDRPSPMRIAVFIRHADEAPPSEEDFFRILESVQLPSK